MTTADSSAALATIGLEAPGGRDNGQALMFQASIHMAQQYPRQVDKILAECLQELTDHPEQAAKSLYSIDYENRRGGTIKPVEGLTIRAAEALGARWRHLQVGVRIAGEDADGYDLEALAWDLQTNYRLLLPFRVTKWETPHGGTSAIKLGETRLLQRLQSGVSKVRRNVTLAVMPAHVKMAYEKRVRELIARGPLDKPANPEVLAAIEASFSEYKLGEAPVGIADLERYLEKPVAKWTGDDLATLRGLYQALVDEETTVAQAFGRSPETAGQPTGPAVVTPATLSQGAATGRNQPARAPRARRDEPSAAERAAATPAKPPAATAAPGVPGLNPDEMATALDTIAQVASEDALNDLLNTYTGATGYMRRASRDQKPAIMDAITAKRAEF